MTSLENTAEPEAWFKLDQDGRQLAVGGAWTIAESARLDRELNGLTLGKDIAIDASKLSRLDSAGAWLLLRTRRTVEAAGGKVSSFNLPKLYLPLLESLDQHQKADAPKSRIPKGWRGRMYKIGRATVLAGHQAYEILG